MMTVVMIIILAIFVYLSYYFHFFSNNNEESFATTTTTDLGIFDANVGGEEELDHEENEEEEEAFKFYFFWASWCPYCQKAKKVWKQFIGTKCQERKNDALYVVAKKSVICIDVDCSESTGESGGLMKIYRVEKFPTFVFDRFGTKKNMPMSGNVSVSDFEDFIQKNI